MIYGITEGTHTCKLCNNNKFTARFDKYPVNDIKHPIGCPHCDATVGYAEGTDDVTTFPYEDKPHYIPKCSECSSEMEIRVNNTTHKKFWVCSRLPFEHRTRNYFGD